MVTKFRRQMKRICGVTTQDALFEYERQKNEWTARNPQATPQQYQQAMREIARKLNI